MTLKPADTAPFNEDVLVFSPDSKDPVMICHRCLFDGQTEADWDGDWHEQNVDMCPNPIDVEVTHWMPLPAAPVT